jgi:peptidylprolyl isomerase
VRVPALIISLCVAIAFAGCGDDDDASTSATESNGSSSAQSPDEAAKRGKPTVSVPKGSPPQQLVQRDLIEGSGPSAEAGDQVTVHYVGVGVDTGEEFDASWGRGEPFSFRLGAGEVIRGWDQGIAGMKAGGQRELVIPADLAYGKAGFPPTIGPDEALVFVVDLLAVE